MLAARSLWDARRSWSDMAKIEAIQPLSFVLKETSYTEGLLCEMTISSHFPTPFRLCNCCRPGRYRPSSLKLVLSGTSLASNPGPRILHTNTSATPTAGQTTMSYGSVATADAHVLYQEPPPLEPKKRSRRGLVFASVGLGICVGVAVLHSVTTNSASPDRGTALSANGGSRTSVPSAQEEVTATYAFTNPHYYKVSHRAGKINP